MIRVFWQYRYARLSSLVLLCIFCSSCFGGAVPVRVSSKTRNAAGQGQSKIDLDFVKVGTTTRDEIHEKLAPIDTGVHDDELFLGRWATSSWGAAWIVGVGVGGGGGGFNRKWTNHNVLVQFDANHLVRQIVYFPDKDFFKTLSDVASQDQNTPMDFSKPIELPIQYITRHGRIDYKLSLDRDSLEFQEAPDRGSINFRIPRKKIDRLTIDRYDGSFPPDLIETFHFGQKTLIGGKMVLQVDVPKTVALLKYLNKTGFGPLSPPKSSPGTVQ